MAAGLKFETAPGKVTTAAGLSDAKIIIYEDNGGNTYTLDASGISGLANIDDIKLSTLKNVVFKYHPSGGTKANVTGLGNIIGALFATQTTSGGKSILAEKVTEQPVVSEILGADDHGKSVLVTKLGELLKNGAAQDYNGGGNPKGNQTPVNFLAAQGKLITEGNLAEKVTEQPVVNVLVPALAAGADATKNVYTQKAVDTALGLKVNLNADNLDEAKVENMLKKITTADKKVVQVSDLPAAVETEVEKPAVAAKILGAKSADNKLVLVTKLAEALDTPGTYYGAGSDQSAKVFLGAKGLKPIAAEVAADQTLLAAVKSDFQAAVKELVSKPVLDIPEDDSAPLNWDF